MSRREILYRGKHKYMFPGNKHLDGVWVEGYLSDENYINAICEDEYGDKYTSEKLIDPETVCQYTGLTDKNGRKIFEGDIVKDGNIYGAVVFDSHYAQFMIDDIHDSHQEYSDWWHEVEVIGNIYDNPELLN